MTVVYDNHIEQELRTIDTECENNEKKSMYKILSETFPGIDDRIGTVLEAKKNCEQFVKMEKADKEGDIVWLQ